MSPQDRQRILRALRDVEGLTEPERLAITGLGLPPYESQVIGYLCVARSLLARDGALSVMQRDLAWAGWLEGIDAALEGALRFSENEPLVIALGLAGALLPAAYPQARLRGFKALDDALLAAQRGVTLHKRERVVDRARIRDRFARVVVWIGPDGELRRDDGLDEAERAALQGLGYRETWGVAFSSPAAREAIRLLGNAIPVVSQAAASNTVVAPA